MGCWPLLVSIIQYLVIITEFLQYLDSGLGWTMDSKLLGLWSIIIINYSLHRSTLSVTHRHTYLGVTLDDHLSWSTHVTNVATQATRMLKCHISKCSSNIKASAYLVMVCRLMEYAYIIWDPHYQSQVSVLEKVQRHAARCALPDYSYHSSVSCMLE